MKKSVLNYLLSKEISLILFQLWSKNNLCWYLLLSLSLILLPKITSAQTISNENSPDWQWAKSAGGTGTDQATGVTTDAEGNVYTAGTFAGTATFGNQTLTSAGAGDIFISKHDAGGNLIWVKQAGGTGADQVSKIITDAAGNIYVAGTFTSTAAFGNSNLTNKGKEDIFIAKYNAAGKVVWAKAEGNASSNRFSEFNISTSDHIYLAGSFDGTINIGNTSITSEDNYNRRGSLFIVKYDNAGSVLWAKDAAGGEGSSATGVTFDAAGNTYATGDFGDTAVFGNITLPEKPGELDYFTVKYDPAGTAVWAKQIITKDSNFGENQAQGGKIITDVAGNVYITGYFSSYASIDFGSSLTTSGNESNEFLVKYFADGKFHWAYIEGTTYNIDIQDISSDLAGNVYVAFNAENTISSSGRIEKNILLKKYSSSGNVIFKKEIFHDVPSKEENIYIDTRNMLADAAGRVYLSFSFWGTADLGEGNLLTSNSQSNIFTAVYDVDGTLLLAQELAVTSLTEKGNNTYLAGSFKNTTSFGDTTLTSNGDTDAFLANLTYFTPPPLVASWDQRYGGRSFERLTSVVKTNDGGYLLGGHSLSHHGGDRSQDTRGRYDFWLVKTDALGAKLWDRSYGGSDDDYLNWIVATADGGYLLAGSSQSGVGGEKTSASRGSQDFWIVKISSDGTKLWDQTYGGSGFEDLEKAIQLSTGEYVLAGVSDSPVSGEKSQDRRGSRDYWLVKVSATGAKLWDKRYGGSKAEELGSFMRTAGGFVLAGSSLSGKNGDKTSESKGGKDYWLVQTDSYGNQLWDKSYGGSEEEELTAMARTTAGELLLAGHSNSGVSGDKSQANRGSSDYWLLKLDAQGTKLWDKTYGGSGAEELEAVLWTQDGGFLLGGSSFSNQDGDKTQASKGSSDYWVVKLDVQGEQEWDQAYGGAGEDRLRYLLQTEDEGYLLGGFSFSNHSGDKSQNKQGRSDYWLVKIPPTPAAIASLPRIAELTEATSIAAIGLKAYPVPAKEKVTVQFTLPRTQPAVVQLYNSQGAKVKTLFQGEVQAHKNYQVEWRPTQQHPPGLYIIQLQAKKNNQSLKILHTK